MHDEKNVNHMQDYVKNYIFQKIGFNEPTKFGIQVHFDCQNIEIHQIKAELIKYLNNEQKPKKDEILIMYCTRDIILCICKSNKGLSHAIHIFSINNSRFHSDFEN